MRRRLVPAALVAVLAFAGCSGGAADAAPRPTSTPTAEVLTDAKQITSLTEGVEYVLAQDPATMTSNDIINAAQKLRKYAGEEYSNAKVGDLERELLKIALDGFDFDANEPAPQLQARLTELAKQVRELG